MVEQALTDTSFASLGLHPLLLAGLSEAGLSCCTPIQAQSLPLVLGGQDVAGQAQTGTGKTAAFLLALMQRLLVATPSTRRNPHDPRAIVLAPTRELAIQINKDAGVLGGHSGLKTALVYGGVDYEKQRHCFDEQVDILIGTPGRIIDYFKQHIFKLNAIEVVVLDEADRMFDLGFIKDVRYLLRKMPPLEKRLSMLFSATLSWRVHELAYEHMNNPQIVAVAPDKVTADKVTQSLFHVESSQKIALLIGLLRQVQDGRSLVFVNTKRAGEQVAAFLQVNGFQVGVLSGDVPQRKRQSLIGRISRGELPILVATDVAARGLHIPDITHVYNFDLPQNAEDYVHRIGRTARAGASGCAVSLACEAYVYSLTDIESYIGHKIPVIAVVPELLTTPESPVAAKKSKRSAGRRPARPRRRRRAPNQGAAPS